MPVRREDDAAHESGHAVVGAYLGLDVVLVTLERTDDFIGAVFWGKLPRALRTHIGITLAAGPAAEALRGIRRSAKRKPPPGWRGDYRAIRGLGFSPAERDLLVQTAMALLQGPCARAHAAVTRALLERDLTGDEVKALVLHGEPIDLDAA